MFKKTVRPVPRNGGQVPTEAPKTQANPKPAGPPPPPPRRNNE